MANGIGRRVGAGMLLAALVAAAAPAAAQPARQGEALDLDPAVAARLSQEQLFELLQERERTRTQRAAIGKDPPLVAIVVPVAFFLSLLLGLATTLQLRFRKDRERHETIRRMVEKGMEVPAALLTPPALPVSDLRRGILLVSAGIGLAIFLRLLHGVPPRLWTVGLVPLLLGLGYLVAWRLEARSRDTRDAAA